MQFDKIVGLAYLTVTKARADPKHRVVAQESFWVIFGVVVGKFWGRFAYILVFVCVSLG